MLVALAPVKVPAVEEQDRPDGRLQSGSPPQSAAAVQQDDD